MINQLQRTSPPYNPTVVENLKFSFTVLGVYRKIFKPASEWVCHLIHVVVPRIPKIDFLFIANVC